MKYTILAIGFLIGLLAASFMFMHSRPQITGAVVMIPNAELKECCKLNVNSIEKTCYAFRGNPCDVCSCYKESSSQNNP